MPATRAIWAAAEAAGSAGREHHGVEITSMGRLLPHLLDEALDAFSTLIQFDFELVGEGLHLLEALSKSSARRDHLK